MTVMRPMLLRVTMRHILLAGSLSAVATSGAACAPMQPPVKNGGPALSQTGLQLSVARQGCSQSSEPDFPGADLVEERVEVTVRNGSSAPAEVHRDRFRLVAPDGQALPPVTWNAADPLMVPGGNNETFELRFMTRGGLECSKEMRLDPDGALMVQARPVAFQPVSFVPTRAL